MKHIIEFGTFSPYDEQEKYKIWKENGVYQTLIKDNNPEENRVYTQEYIYEVKLARDKYTNSLIVFLNEHCKILKIFTYFRVFNFICYRLRTIFNSLSLRKIIKKIEQEKGKVDAIILNHAYGSESPFFLDRKKTFFVIHSDLSKTWLWSSFSWKLLAKIAFRNKNIICVSESSMKDFQSLNIPYRTLNFVVNGVHTDIVQKKAKEKLPEEFENKEFILTVARLSYEKQIDKIIEAFYYSKIPCAFVIIGDGLEKNKIQNVIKKFNYQDKVHLLGWDSNPYRWMRKAKFFVIFSLYEGGPYTNPESLICGTPVISTNVGNTRTYLQKPELQKYVIEDHNDIKALSLAMQNMYKDPPKVEKNYGQQFSMRNQISDYIKVIQKSLEL